jgi:ankyrin repeat protein
LLWASNNGNEELVDLLIEKQAHSGYTLSNNDDVDQYDEKDTEEEANPFQKPKDARKVGRYTPLHWSSYKGHYSLVCKFLKKKLNPLDIDMYGNTAVH